MMSGGAERLNDPAFSAGHAQKSSRPNITMVPLTQYHTIHKTRVMSSGRVTASSAARTGLTPKKPWPIEPSMIVTAENQYATVASIRVISTPQIGRPGGSTRSRRRHVERRELQPLELFIERPDVTEQDLLKPIGLCLQLGGEVREDRCSVPDRLAIAGVHHPQQRGNPVVDLDGKVQGILVALIPDLVNLFLDRAEPGREPIGSGFQAGIGRLRQPIANLLLERTNLDHRVVGL